MAEDDKRGTVAGSGAALAAAVLVAGVTAALALPPALASWLLSPDSIEHLAIAHSAVSGQGFVDPVRFNFYLNLDLPVPGFAMRAPAISAAAAIPLALGAGVGGVLLWHTVAASLLTGALVLVARRFMSTPAALAAALLFGLSPAWLRLTTRPLTEAIGVGGLLLVLGTARGVLRSVPGALACSAATVLAWTARPNLIALAAAVIVAAIWEIGPRRALRHVPLWWYGAGVIGLTVGVRTAVVIGTGLAPYESYAAGPELLGIADGFRYQKEYMGAAAFIQSHAGAIFHRIGLFLDLFVKVLCFKPKFHFVGWLLLPAVAYALHARRSGSFEYRILALSALGFSLLVVSYYTAFDTGRYPIFVALCTSLCALAAADDAARRIAGRAGAGVRRRAALALPLAAVLLLIAVSSGPRSARGAANAWRSFRQHGTDESSAPGAVTRALCGSMARRGIVAARDPWSIVLWCGNAAVRLPTDLVNRHWQNRFLDEQHVRYLVQDGHREAAWLGSSPRLRRIDTSSPFTLYEVKSPVAPAHPWTPPVPLACAGRGPDC